MAEDAAPPSPPESTEASAAPAPTPVVVVPTDAATDWRRLHLLQIQPVRDLLVAGLVLGVFYLGYVLSPVTVPMLLALALAYLVEPVVHRVTARGRVSRPAAAVAVIVLVILVVAIPLSLGVGFAIIQGVNTFGRVESSVQALMTWFNEPTEENMERIPPKWRPLADLLHGATDPAAPGSPGGTDERPPRPAESGGAGGPATPPEGAQPDGAARDGGESERDAERPVLNADLLKEEKEKQQNGDVDVGEAAQPPDTFAEEGPGGGPAVDSPEEAMGLGTRLGNWLQEQAQMNMAGVGRVLSREVLGTGADAVQLAWRFVAGTGYLLFAWFLVLFFFFFFCTGYQRVLRTLEELIPKWKKARVLEQVRQMDEVVAGFVRGRLIIMMILIGMFVAAYWVVGVPAPLVVGALVGVLSVVPYLSMVGIPIAIVMMWLRQDPPAGFMGEWWWVLLAPTVAYFLVQTIDDYVLTPMIQGKTTQMDTPSILFAVLAGGILAGFYGVLLSIPAAACIKILLRESFWPRFKAWSEGRIKDFLPVSRYDPTEAGTPAPAASTPAVGVAVVPAGGSGGTAAAEAAIDGASSP